MSGLGNLTYAELKRFIDEGTARMKLPPKPIEPLIIVHPRDLEAAKKFFEGLDGQR